MLIYGVSGAGKSLLLEKFQRDHAQTDERWHSSVSGRRWLECGGHGPSHPFISPFDEGE